jgi:signal transduction histidine kinase/ActR/RegA family two-component response regulator
MTSPRRARRAGSIARTLADIAHLFDGVADGQRRVENAFHHLQDLVPYDQAALLECREGNTRVRAVPNVTGEERAALEGRLARFLHLLIAEHELRRADTRTTASRLPQRDGHLAVPLVACDRVLGVLFVSRQHQEYTQQELSLLSVVAAHLASYLTTLRLTEEEAAHLDAERRARAEADHATRARDEFLAMLGHELQNPLAALRNAVVIARLDEAGRDRALEIVKRQSDQLGRIVEDLLNVARVASGRITLRREPVLLATVVEHAVESALGLIQDRHHDLVVSLPNEPLQVSGDPVRLEQVVTNLLANAAKYTNPGGRIEVLAEPEGDAAVLRVRDNGMGLAPELLPHLFDLFTQGKRELDRAPGGLGIGLTVAKGLVELHGGTITADSAGPGKGSEFVVRLPALGVTETPSEAPARLPAVSAKLRVLIVEDNPDVAEALLMLLEVFGHQVVVTRDGPAALDALQASPPDVAFIDIGLPGMDGYEVVRKIRALPGVEKVTLVAMTGYGRQEDSQRALAAGFDHHLRKPVNLDALQDLIGRLGRAENEPER